jgi:hypothetical protein
MPSEVALNVPFDSNEVKDIAVEEFRKRLDGLSPLSGGKEYAAFSLDFNVKITLRRSGETDTDARETLAWGSVIKGGLPSAADLDAVAAEMETAEATSRFESRDPNEERQARDLPLTVEGSDGRGNKVRRKVKVKG